MNTHIVKIKQHCGDIVNIRMNLGSFLLTTEEMIKNAKKEISRLSFEERKGEVVSVKRIIQKDSISKPFGNPRNNK